MDYYLINYGKPHHVPDIKLIKFYRQRQGVVNNVSWVGGSSVQYTISQGDCQGVKARLIVGHLNEMYAAKVLPWIGLHSCIMS